MLRYYLVPAVLTVFAAPLSFAESPGDASASRPEKAEFSVHRGHYDEAFELEIRAAGPGFALVYTTDGSEPSADPINGVHVPTGPQGGPPSRAQILVDDTMSVRAIAVSTGSTSKVATHSYVFPHKVLQQAEPARSTAHWGHSGPDWEVDPQVVEHRDPASRLVAKDLLAIPALHISLSFDDLWGDGGIYLDGESDPRDCYVELLNPAANPDDPNQVAGLHKHATVEVTGGSSTERWKTDKLSLRLRFHHEARFPFLSNPGTDPDGEPVDHFHTLILDARLNESWTHPSASQREYAQYTRDQFLADLHRAAGGLAPRGRHVHLYIAGVYWGLYNLHERPDHHFAAAYRGGKAREWEVVKHNAADIVNGDGSNFRKLQDRISQPDIASAQAFEEVAELLDVEDFARYMLVNFWAGNTDWSHQNWYAICRVAGAFTAGMANTS